MLMLDFFSRVMKARKLMFFDIINHQIYTFFSVSAQFYPFYQLKYSSCPQLRHP